MYRSEDQRRVRGPRLANLLYVGRVNGTHAHVAVRLAALAALVACALGGSLAAAAELGAARENRCSGTTEGAPPQTSPEPGASCWVEVSPYPFGSDGAPVDVTSGRCRPAGSGQPLATCYLPVTSVAFRAWNRGLAATDAGGGAFGVWLWNGARWYPDPTFPGTRICRGDRVLWAGKLDYWLVGSGDGTWPSLCRFDGSRFLWQPIPVPASATRRVTDPGATSPASGGITTGTCNAWNDCWFFGSHGTVLRWNGRQLSDASPGPESAWLNGAYTAAMTGIDRTGNPVGLAISATSTDARGAAEPPVPPPPDGSAPPQLRTSAGAQWTALRFTPPTSPLPGDPFRTDLVAVAYDAARERVWVAGNPAALRTGLGRFDYAVGRGDPTTLAPAPVLPLDPLGNPIAACAGPASGTFRHAAQGRTVDTYLWSSIGVLPDTGDALVGGQVRLADSGFDNDTGAEPVIAQIGCDGAVTRVRFRIPDPLGRIPGPGTVAANRLGAISALSVTAPNDGWAPTTRGQLSTGPATTAFQPPRLYRLRDGQPTQAADGDDKETRPLQIEVDPPIFVFEPLPPPEPPPAAQVTNTTRTVKLKPAVFAVKVRARKLDLYVSMKVRRPVVLGVSALRKGKVVATTGFRQLRPPSSVLRLKLDPRRWPDAISFVNDLPRGSLARLPASLRSTLTLKATGLGAIRGRSVRLVRFEYAAATAERWTTISSAEKAPWSVAFDTTKVANGRYRFRVVVTDSAGRLAVSKSVARSISNDAPPAAAPPAG